MPELNTNLLANIGQNVPSYSKALGQSTQLKDIINQEQLGELQVSQAKAQGEKDKQIKDLASKADFSTPEGQTKFASDVTKVDPAKGMDFMKQIQEMMKSTGDNEKTQIELIGERADHEANAALPLLNQYQNMISKGVPPQQAAAQMQPAYQQALQSLASVKLKDGSPLLGPEQLKQIIAHPTFDPEFVSGIVQQSKQAREAMTAQQKTSNDTAAVTETARHDKVMEGQGQQKVDIQETKLKQAASTGNIDPDTLTDLASQYNITGKLPPLGRGDGAMVLRTKILNESAKQLKDAGQTEQGALVAQAAYKAGQQALGAVQKSQGMVGTFEKTAKANMQLVKDTAAKVDRSGSPLMNKWILAGRKSIAGDPDIAKFDAALTTFAEEYAKVMTGSTGAASATDSARTTAHEMINRAQTPEMLNGVLDTMSKEMDNRMSAYDDQINELKGNMGLVKQPAASSANLPTATNPKTGEKMVYKDGKWQTP